MVDELLHEDVPQPGTVAGVRTVRLTLDLGLDTPVFRERTATPLLEALGFIAPQASGKPWQYDRAKVLDWFFTQLRGLDYRWVQDPWRMDDSQPQYAPPNEAGPQPLPRERRDEVTGPTYNPATHTWRQVQ